MADGLVAVYTLVDDMPVEGEAYVCSHTLNKSLFGLEDSDPRQRPYAPPPTEEVEETWEEKEDKLDAENIQPQSPAPATPTEQKYQYKEGKRQKHTHTSIYIFTHFTLFFSGQDPHRAGVIR